MIVCKFGGTSLRDASCFSGVARILRRDGARRVAVPSAPGRLGPDGEKITDLLARCHAPGVGGFAAPFCAVRERFRQIALELGFGGMLDAELAQIEARLPRESRDWALSRGEYLSGRLLARLMGWTFLDAAEAVRFGADGRCDAERTALELRARMPETGGLVLPGFYGAMPGGAIRTFPRGGSDITGAIAARALGASLYENWTDVPGVLAADPRVVPHARLIASLDYRELRELAAMGAGVLQEEAVLPVREAGIPIAIRSTFAPESPGTLILPLPEGGGNVPPVTGVAARRGFAPILLEKTLLRADPAFLQKALGVLSSFSVPAEHLLCGVDAMCLVTPREPMETCREALLRALFDALAPDSLEIGPPLSLVAVVGRGLRGQRGVAASVLGALSEAGIRARMLDYGAGGRTLLVGVNEADCDEAARAAYRGAFGE